MEHHSVKAQPSGKGRKQRDDPSKIQTSFSGQEPSSKVGSLPKAEPSPVGEGEAHKGGETLVPTGGKRVVASGSMPLSGATSGKPDGSEGEAAGGNKRLSGTPVEGRGVPAKKKKQKRRKKRQMAQAETAIATPAKEEEGSKKRTSSELSTPSPLTKVQQKRPRADPPPRSFAQVARDVKVAVVKEGYPTLRLQSDEVLHIQEDIINKIDDHPGGVGVPIINGTNYNAGALFLMCQGEATVDWVRQTYDGNAGVLGGFTLRMLTMDQMPKPIKVAFKTKDTVSKEPRSLLRRLQKINPDLKSEDWRVLHHVAEAQSSRWIFEVDLESLRAIQRAGYSGNTGLDRGTFRVLHNPYDRKEQEEAGEATSTQVSTAEPRQSVTTAESDKVSDSDDTRGHSSTVSEIEEAMILGDEGASDQSKGVKGDTSATLPSSGP